MSLFWLAGFAFKHSYEQAPDFRIQAEQFDQKMDEMFEDIDIGMPVPVGTPVEEIERLRALEQKQQLAERAARIENSISDQEQRFEQNKEERFDDGIMMTKYALFVCSLGSLLLRIRYPFRRKE